MTANADLRAGDDARLNAAQIAALIQTTQRELLELRAAHADYVDATNALIARVERAFLTAERG